VASGGVSRRHLRRRLARGAECVPSLQLSERRSAYPGLTTTTAHPGSRALAIRDGRDRGNDSCSDRAAAPWSVNALTCLAWSRLAASPPGDDGSHRLGSWSLRCHASATLLATLALAAHVVGGTTTTRVCQSPVISIIKAPSQMPSG
jgi:hypothetical protein